ncbi:putative sugar transferase EpsL [Oxobacter pfennigii]|uniref:Putative sugar transferase EpsL n=1 Tax=Oxobacter pfennigii TaxID=36849 RepID=A0A0P8W529_9CLOT|nr:sugar transferase [Oxobacter pfennigii]KPU43705.1 putative sugar transferase EpsL [Oxobacter pfennigii]
MDREIAIEDSLVHVHTNEDGVYLFFKRLMDITGSLFGIIILSPVFIITALLIKLDSEGPILFKQLRCGKNGKKFFMLKFRSMQLNAEELKETLKDKNEQTGPVFKIKDDPRITKIGKFIRRTSIDELPQLINILKGDMSIVGPRPPLPSEVLQYTEYQKQRLMVKPGLTCYWQVMGRNSVGFDEWVKLDIKYIEERSFWLDIKLILKTVKVLFGDVNAS